MEAVSCFQVVIEAGNLGLVTVFPGSQPGQLAEGQLVGRLVDPGQFLQIFVVEDDKLVVLSLVNVHFNVIRMEAVGLFHRRNGVLDPVFVRHAPVGDGHWPLVLATAEVEGVTNNGDKRKQADRNNGDRLQSP